jgi:GT2 family glycosyltransferase
MKQQPSLSVVVPTCARVPALSALLERLRPERQGMDPRTYEVIVSDDAVNDPAAARLGQEFPSVRFVTGPGRGPAANRNNGARYARAEWIVFIDDDCQPVDGWLRAVAAEIDARALDVVEGKIVAPDKKTSLFRRDVENLSGDCFWSANLAVRREYFEQIGRFDEDFTQAGGEDLELAHRFRSRGARTSFCADAIVNHPSHVMTWSALLEFTFRMRWHALYLLKTGQMRSDDTRLWKVIPHVIAWRVLALLRTTRHRLRIAWRQPAILGSVVFEWALFPVVLPYLVYWHLYFLTASRQRLQAPAGTDEIVTP